MSFTETTTTSWFSRLKSGVAKIFIGLLFVVVAIVALFWNEGRSVNTYRALAEGSSIVVPVDSGAVDAVNEGKLVHISGAAKAVGTPQDQTFGISAEGAARLSRSVEMFQWVESSQSETKKTLGGGEETVTTYSYNREWKSGRVDSSDFREQAGHTNPQLAAEGDSFTVASGTVGAFSIDGDALANIGDRSAVSISQPQAQEIGGALGGRNAISQAGTVLVSNSPQNPQVGDLKIAYTRYDVREASIVGAQHAATIVPFRASNGRDIFLTGAGLQTAPEMFETAQSENTVITWIIRVAGLFGLFIGFAMMFSLLGIIADVIPFVGSIVSFGTTLIALILTLLIGPLVIAIAWFAYRPLLAIGVLAAGVLLAVAIFYLKRGKAQPASVPPGGGFGRGPAG